MPTGVGRIVECACGCGRSGINRGRRLLHSCYTNLYRKGKKHLDFPLERIPGPPRIYKVRGENIAERLERYAQMRRDGLSKNETAIQLGVSYRTVQRYDVHLRHTEENTMGSKPNDHLADELATSTDKKKNEEIVRKAIEDSKADDTETDKRMGK